MIADELCLMAHDEHSGRPKVHPDTLGLALAGALLAELVLTPFLVHPPGALPFTKYLTVREGLVGIVAGPPAAPFDALQHWVFETVAAERRPLHVDTWLRLFARDSAQRVVERLIRHGLAVPVGERRALARLRKEPGPCQPADPSWAAFLAVRLRGSLNDPSRITLPEVALTGLIAATELIHNVVLWEGEKVPAHVHDLLRRLPRPLQELIAHTQATLATVVLAR
ncbi:MAG: GPP34 family phosphoprotein [Micromonosporaceae bacterium]